jgi:type I restriction enzyme M protein
MQNIEHLEKRLWGAADLLRANSNLNSSEYMMPVLGIIFLRHAYSRYLVVKAEVEPTLPVRGGVRMLLTKDHFTRKAALYLRPEAQFDYLLALPGDRDLGKAINDAMTAIEEDYPAKLKGVLPKDYARLSDDLLRQLLKIFNDEALRRAGEDIFGRINEYFLLKFAMARAQDEGEFFTPPSLTGLITYVIEPDHGILWDPALGSGGMYVQAAHFVERTGQTPQEIITFYGQEKSTTNLRIALMNMAVHNLEGQLVEANTYYEDRHAMVGRADFVMANPPFNVDGVDEKVKDDGARLPFGIPGTNKEKKISNANYLWISYFYSALNETGRAGFVMSSQTSSAGQSERDVRRKIVQTGHVDAMIAIRSNFFYTRTVPCELWFFDRGKPAERRDKVLMLDARSIYHKVTRVVYDFTPEQLQNLAAIVWLYRGETPRFTGSVRDYLARSLAEARASAEFVAAYRDALAGLGEKVTPFLDTETGIEILQANRSELAEAEAALQQETDALAQVLRVVELFWPVDLPDDNTAQHRAADDVAMVVEVSRALIQRVEHSTRTCLRLADLCEREFNARKADEWETAAINRLRKGLTEQSEAAIAQLRQIGYFHRQAAWLQERFPDAALRDVEGLVKVVTLAEIKEQDWSLTPGRYVGMAAPEEEEGFDFEQALREIHGDLAGLNEEAAELADRITANFESLGI